MNKQARFDAPKGAAFRNWPTEDGLEMARLVEDDIRAHSVEMDKTASVPQELIDKLYDIGLFHTFTPKAVGGLELHHREWLRFVEEISRYDGSIGWMAMNQCGFGWTFLKPHDYLAEWERCNGKMIHAMTFGRFGGKAWKKKGGYEVEGYWPFMSGAPWATHHGGAAILHDEDDAPVLHEDGLPWLIPAMWPAEWSIYEDVWDGMGLRASGSGNVKLERRFIPNALINQAGFQARRYPDTPRYNIPLLAVQAHGAHAVGVAQSALDAFLNDVKVRAGFGSLRQAALGREQYHQIEFADADIKVRAARLLLRDTVDRAVAYMEDTGENDLPLEMQVEMRQEMVWVKHTCMEAVEKIFKIAGAGAVHRGKPLERIYRDMSTAAAHLLTAEIEMASVGSYYITKDLMGGPQLVGRPFF